MIEAKHYEKLENNLVKCNLCPKHCIIKPNSTGFCLVRKNIDGKLYTFNDKISTIAVDPIEKKPLYHFLPFSKILSIGANGCNFDCKFCQNFEISRNLTEKLDYSERDIVEIAKVYGIPSIAYTYNEPTVFYEFMLETAKLAKKEGIKNVIVSNGFIEKEPLEELLPFLDAANIDLKGNSEFYKKICNGNVDYVMKNIETLTKNNVWVEITFLVIDGYNDNLDSAEEMFKWLNQFNDKIALHITRFFPMREFINLQPTKKETLEKMYNLAKKYLDFVYLGNIFTDKINTHCPKCNSILIDRIHFKKKIKCECGYELIGRFI
ncbi:MAG: AmmeMemoRadiSam system radical SAM enzyme [Candidatus Woesearchaeota archaeon]